MGGLIHVSINYIRNSHYNRSKKGSPERATIPFFILFTCWSSWILLSNVLTEYPMFTYSIIGLLNGYLVV
jgi:hypothetical protein